MTNRVDHPEVRVSPDGDKVTGPEAESKDYLRRQWATASAKLNTAETKLRREQQLHGFAQDRICGLEADIATRWQTANIDETVKTELRHRTAEADTLKEAIRDLLEASQQYQLIGVTKLGLRLGFYPDDLERALEVQNAEIQRLRNELTALRDSQSWQRFPLTAARLQLNGHELSVLVG